MIGSVHGTDRLTRLACLSMASLIVAAAGCAAPNANRAGGTSTPLVAQYAVQVGGRDAAAPAPPSGFVDAGARPSRAQQLLGDIAPRLAQLTDSVLFGDVWARPGLSRRDRSLVTVSALITLNRPDQLRSHVALALENGVTRDELVEAITHLAFYAGWPSPTTAVGIARQVFNEAGR